jgi:hypothetical protein
VDESYIIRNQTGAAQQIRNGRGARVALCVHPSRINEKITYSSDVRIAKTVTHLTLAGEWEFY